MRAVAAAVFLVACGGSSSAPAPGSASASAAAAPDDCTVAARHVIDVIGFGAKPEERRVFEVIIARAIDVCHREGLSTAQRDCILALRVLSDPSPVATCPAIVAKTPSWLVVDATGIGLSP